MHPRSSHPRRAHSLAQNYHPIVPFIPALSQRFSVRQMVFRVSRMMSKPIFAHERLRRVQRRRILSPNARRSASLAIGGVPRSHRRLVARSSATLPRRASICDRSVLIQLSQRAPHRSQPRRDARRPRPLAPNRRQSSRTSQCYSMRIDVACSVNAADAIENRSCARTTHENAFAFVDARRSRHRASRCERSGRRLSSFFRGRRVFDFFAKTFVASTMPMELKLGRPVHRHLTCTHARFHEQNMPPTRRCDSRQSYLTFFVWKPKSNYYLYIAEKCDITRAGLFLFTPLTKPMLCACQDGVCNHQMRRRSHLG